MGNTLRRLLVAKNDREIYLLAKMANRHGLIAGATGTGKTVTLQVLAESLSSCGVPVFLADVKGDLSGLSKSGAGNPHVEKCLTKLGLDADTFAYDRFPVVFWDVYGRQGHAVRTTISEMGPLLLARLLNLNEIQSGVLNLVFRIADDRGMLLLDLKDLKAMLNYVGEKAQEFTTEYGTISKQSVGIIQRALLSLEEQGGNYLFGEPALNILDILKTDADGRGHINILAANKLYQSPTLYATFLLWLLAELFEVLPEAGDIPQPKLVFFFDEAHLLFDEAPKVLLDKIEQVVRLIRSKGVGVFFVTQNPLDIPEEVLGQLGNRVQHALRAFTPRDQKAVKAAAETFRANPTLNVTEAITALGVGEALVSFLDEEGRPAMVERAFIVPPRSQIGAIPEPERNVLIAQSSLRDVYDRMIDRESAYELLSRINEAAAPDNSEDRAEKSKSNQRNDTDRSSRKRRNSDSPLEKFAKSAMSSIGTQIGRALVRGFLGSLKK